MADIRLDYNFDLPPHVADVYYVKPERIGYFDDDEIDSDSPEFRGSDADEDGSSGDNDDGEEPGLRPPLYMHIVSQSVKTLKGGGQVVDVTIELPDLPEGDKYEMRLTKA